MYSYVEREENLPIQRLVWRCVVRLAHIKSSLTSSKTYVNLNWEHTKYIKLIVLDFRLNTQHSIQKMLTKIASVILFSATLGLALPIEGKFFERKKERKEEVGIRLGHVFPLVERRRTDKRYAACSIICPSTSCAAYTKRIPTRYMDILVQNVTCSTIFDIYSWSLSFRWARIILEFTIIFVGLLKRQWWHADCRTITRSRYWRKINRHPFNIVILECIRSFSESALSKHNPFFGLCYLS